jgi:kumamolisin
MKQKLVSLPGSRRAAKSGAKRIGDVDPRSSIEVTLDLRGPALPDASNLPRSALSYNELTKEFGASATDAQKVAKVLKGYGLKIKEISLGTRSMRVSGTATAMEKAFKPNLGIYMSRQQGEFRGREGGLAVPQELKGIIRGVNGFDQRRVAHRKTNNHAGSHTLAPLAPSDLLQRYNFPSGDGAGQTIGIAEFGGGYFADDLKAYCQKHGSPVPSVKVVSVNLKPLTLKQIENLPPADQNDELGAASEVMMDVQIIAGLCPKAKIVMYFATFDQKGWIDLLDKVIKSKPVSLSVSWGAPEDSPDWSQNARDAINQRLNMAALVGITCCISSGDDGSGDELADGKGHVDFPGSSPFVLSVGGTMLSGQAPNIVEQVWWQSPGRRIGNGHSGAGGGGVSVCFQRPTWQSVSVKSINSGNFDGRVVPDVAALAGPPLYDLTFLGGDSPNGGTSASAPLWAALIARINALLPANKQQRFLTPLLYQPNSNGKTVGESGCQDIVQGQNASHPQPGVGYKAAKGYDPVTGWGVPDGTALLAALQ